MPFFKFTDIAVSGIASAVPTNTRTLEVYKQKFGLDTVEAFLRKTGIQSLHQALNRQTASDLGYVAAKNIIANKQVQVNEIGLILFISKTPDYRSPATATVLHHRLSLPVDCIAFDMNLGGAGFIYGIQAGCSLLSSINTRYGLIVVGDTTSKQVSPEDPLSMMFGDGAAAILLEKKAGSDNICVLTKSDSTRVNSFIVPGGGFRAEITKRIKGSHFSEDNNTHRDHLVVDFSELSRAETIEIPVLIREFLAKDNSSLTDYDFFPFHQGTLEVINEIAMGLDLPLDTIASNISRYGNTSGCSVPLLLCDTFGNSEREEVRVLAYGFGEGLSMGVASLVINGSDVLPISETDEFFVDGAVSHDFK